MKCSTCKRELSEDQFYKTKNYWHEKRGRTYVCKDCARASARKSAAEKRLRGKDGTTESINKSPA